MNDTCLIVLEGTFGDGFVAYGPFHSELAADAFMEDHGKDVGPELLHLMYVKSPLEVQNNDRR